MRNFRAEKSIDKILATRFELDNSRYDVTVLKDEAEITGVFFNRYNGQPLNQMQIRTVEHYFHYGTIPGVSRYFFHIHPAHAGT